MLNMFSTLDEKKRWQWELDALRSDPLESWPVNPSMMRIFQASKRTQINTFAHTIDRAMTVGFVSRFFPSNLLNPMKKHERVY